MSIKEDGWFSLLVGVVVIIAALGCFINLGGRNFGVDEAETAVLGENILSYGIPRAWNGRGLIDEVTVRVNAGWVNGLHVNEDLVFTSHPWLPYYLSALLISIFGKSHFWLRAGFALFGFAGLILLYSLVKNLSNRWVALLTLIIVAGNVHYYLFTRSFRHYPLNIFFAVLAVWGYFFLESRWGKLCLTLGLTLLYHTNYIPFAVLYLALAAMLLIERDWAKIRTFIGCSLLISLFTLPAFFYLETYKTIGAYRNLSPLLDYAGFIKDVNARFVPLILFIGYGLWLLTKTQWQLKNNKEQQLKLFCLIYPLTSMLIEPLIIPEILVRNASPVLLFISLAVAYLLETLFCKSRLWAVVLTVLLLFTTILSEIFYYPGLVIFATRRPSYYQPYINKIKTYLGEIWFPGKAYHQRYINKIKTHPWQAFLKMEPYYFIQELYTPFYSSQQAIIEFLTEHGQDGDIVYYYSDEARALQFYTNFRLAYQVHKNSPFRYKFTSLPAWAITDDYFDWYIPIYKWDRQRMLDHIRQQGGKCIRYELKPLFLTHWDLPFEHLFIPYIQDCHLHLNPVKSLRPTEVYRILWPPVEVSGG